MSKLLNNVEKEIKKKVYADISCREWRSSIVLEGTVDNWNQVISAGKIAAKKGYKGVVNKIQVKGLVIPEIKKPDIKDKSLENKEVDVLIIGGGVIGCSIARELSKWQLDILLVEKEEDLAVHASSRNDGMIHPGLDPTPGSKKALYCVRGNKLYSRVTKELGVPFRRTGSYVLLQEHILKIYLPFLKLRAYRNKVEGVRYFSKKQIEKRLPYITKEIVGGIYLPTTGVLSPYKLTIAYGENAIQNGAEISFNTIVLSMEMDRDIVKAVNTNRGTIYPKMVINAAGVYSDEIANMAGDQFFTIHPRKGQVILTDKKKGKLIDTVVAKLPLRELKENTKGGGVVKTIDGNILMGPDALEQPYREDYSTSKESIEAIMKKHLSLVPQLSSGDIITYFTGIRAATYEEDFIIEASEYVRNLIHAAGIQSPGLASAPAIAEDIEKITIAKLNKIMEVKPKQNWKPEGRSIPHLSSMTIEERARLIKYNPDYGKIICRCEEISRGEIIDAIKSPIPALSIDAIKRRARAGMGRCQGGFCMPLISQIITEVKGIDLLSVTKKGCCSEILLERTKVSGRNRRGKGHGKI